MNQIGDTEGTLRQSEPDQAWTYEEIAAKCHEIRGLLQSLKVRLHRDSALGVILREAEALAQEWKMGKRGGSLRRLINAAHANRIAGGLLAAQEDNGALECFKRMAGNDMNLSRRSPSQGKDALWELELGSFMKRRGVKVDHVDPPDLVVDLGFGAYPLACKKVYSEKGVEARLRDGAKQLKAYDSPGLVAINIDDLVPEDSLLQSATQATASDFLAKWNEEFIERHRFHMQRYVNDGRCDGVIVSTTVLADIVGSRTRFNTYTQATLWTLNNIEPVASERVLCIRQVLERKP
jgi:hypothetical protein